MTDADCEDREASADQRAWVLLATEARKQLALRVAEMGAMNPSELKNFVGALDDAYWFHCRCAVLDHKVAAELARQPFDSN